MIHGRRKAKYAEELRYSWLTMSAIGAVVLMPPVGPTVRIWSAIISAKRKDDRPCRWLRNVRLGTPPSPRSSWISTQARRVVVTNGIVACVRVKVNAPRESYRILTDEPPELRAIVSGAIKV